MNIHEESIYRMEEKIGRKLKIQEVVHHLDGNPYNNNEENLMLMKNTSEHIKWHWENDNKYKETHILGISWNYKRRRKFNIIYPLIMDLKNLKTFF